MQLASDASHVADAARARLSVVERRALLLRRRWLRLRLLLLLLC